MSEQLLEDSWVTVDCTAVRMSSNAANSEDSLERLLLDAQKELQSPQTTPPLHSPQTTPPLHSPQTTPPLHSPQITLQLPSPQITPPLQFPQITPLLQSPPLQSPQKTPLVQSPRPASPKNKSLSPIPASRPTQEKLSEPNLDIPRLQTDDLAFNWSSRPEASPPSDYEHRFKRPIREQPVYDAEDSEDEGGTYISFSTLIVTHACSLLVGATLMYLYLKGYSPVSRFLRVQ